MKKNLTKFLALGGIGLLMLSACKKDGALVTSNGGKAGTLTASVSTLPLDKTKITDPTKVINFSFTSPNFGYSAAVTNTLQIDVPGDNWKNPTSATLGVKANSQGYSTADFNNLVLKLNVPAGVATPIQVRVMHSISPTVAPVYSNTVSLTVTAFNLTSWLYITGAFSNWDNPGPAEDSLISVTGNGVYTGIINFTAGNNQFLILPAKNWSNKYATSQPTNLVPSTTVTYNAGNNINAPAAAGHYWVTFNLNTGSISFTPADHYSVIGNAALGWNNTGNDVEMKYINDGSATWVVTTPLSVELPPNDGYKIRKNDDWGVSYGTPNPPNGTQLVNASGDLNIGNAVAGTYKITFWLNSADNTGNSGFWTAVKQ